MKLKFTADEKKIAARQLAQIAIEAAQVGDREIHRQLMRAHNSFTPNAVVSHVNRSEAELLLDISKRTLFQLETEVIPNIEKSDKSDKEKEEALSNARHILSVTQSIITKIEAKVNVSS